jgi:hypothetical protein
MRFLSVVIAMLFLAGGAAAQAPAVKPIGTLAQLMRGTLFHSSNLIFEAQTKEPEKDKIDASPGTGYANIYTGWQVVENAAISLAEVAPLLLAPGRLCQNGKPAPIQQAEYQKGAAALVAAGQQVLKAAQAKNQDAVIEATNSLADACATCHEPFRDVAGGIPNRCTPR